MVSTTPNGASGTGARSENHRPSFSNGSKAEIISPMTEVMTVGELVGLLGSKVDGFNALEVVQYLKESKLARKVSLQIEFRYRSLGLTRNLRNFLCDDPLLIMDYRSLGIVTSSWSKSSRKVSVIRPYRLRYPRRTGVTKSLTLQLILFLIISSGEI
jgi:hypothetical protein